MRRLMRRERGTSVVEMAIVTPFLLLVVLGLVDLGRALYTNINIQEAAQEGAIWASFEPFDPAQTVARVTDAIDNPSLNGSNIGIACPNPGEVTVTVTYDYPMITPLLSQWMGGSITLQQTVTGQIVSENACTPFP